MFPNATVFVVDDDQQARESVCALVESRGISTKTFPSAEAFIVAYEDPHRGCLVTDLRMLGMSGLELQEVLIQRGILLPVIIITAHAQTPLTVRAMRNGAVTLLEKPYQEDELWDAVCEALERDSAQVDQHAHRQERRRRIDTLSSSERQIMDYVVAGKANKVIARQLDVSVRTVESRRHNVFTKLKVKSVAELVQLVIDAKLDG